MLERYGYTGRGRGVEARRPGCMAVVCVLAAMLALSSARLEAQAQAPPAPAGAGADTIGLSLAEAVARATGQSEEVRLARSRVGLADAQVTSVRAQALPQISSTLAYTRTFASPFSGGIGIALPDSLRFAPDPTLPLEERVRYLERSVPTAALGGLASLFGSLPFGQENAYVASLGVSQLLYSGGRVGAALNIARDFREAARLNLAEEVAEIQLQVQSAYYGALLARELEAIAAASLAQAEQFLAEERLRLRAGRASELEVLRAEVSRDNLRPQLVRARNAAELALLDVKRLVDLPMGSEVRLTTRLEAPPAEVRGATELAPEVRLAQRAALGAAAEQVEMRRQQLRIARGSFLPSVGLTINYGRQLFPGDPLSLGGEWRTDFTAGLAVQLPIFNGGQRFAELEQARVELTRAELQLAQLREAVQLQYEQALGEKRRAREAIAARRTTVQAAQRVHELTVLRYEQGLATQLEVSQARLELLQARTNLAQAIADYHIADAGLARALADGGAAALPGPPAVPDADRVGAEADTPLPRTRPRDRSQRTERPRQSR